MSSSFIVIDDHEIVLNGTVSALQKQYPDAKIQTMRSAQGIMEQISQSSPSLVLVDLSIPSQIGEMPKVEVGIDLLKQIMIVHPQLNLVVQSTHVQALIRLKAMIAEHEGGFTIADKNQPINDLLTKIEWSLRGVVYTPKEIRSGIEVKPEWLDMLKLAFEEGLQDKAIADHMNVAERTVRRYWLKVQDALEIYPDENKNIRIQTEKRAREVGLID